MTMVDDIWTAPQIDPQAPPLDIPSESGVQPRPVAPSTPPAAPPPSSGTGTLVPTVRARFLGGTEEAAPGPVSPAPSMVDQVWQSDGAQMDGDFVKTLTSASDPADISRYGTVGKILDFINRPSDASAMVADYLYKTLNERYKDYTPDTFVETGAFGAVPSYGEVITKEDADRMLDLAWRGLKGDKTTTWDNFMRELHPDMNPWKRAALSLTLAIATDPSNLIPFKTLTSLGVKGATTSARATARGIAAITPDVIKESAFVEKLGKVAQLPGKAFIPGYGTPIPWRDMKSAVRFERAAGERDILDWAAEITRGMKKDDFDTLSAMREHPELAANIPSYVPIKQKLESLGNRLDGLIESAHTDGLINDMQYLAWKAREGTYLPHIYPHTRMMSGALPPQWVTEKPFFVKQRKFETLDDVLPIRDAFTEISKAKTIDEFNTLLGKHAGEIDVERAFKAAPGAITDPTMLDSFKAQSAAWAKRLDPITNSVESTAIRALQQNTWKARKELVDGALAKFGRKVPSDTVVPREGYGLYFPRGHIRFFPAEVIDIKFKNELEEAAAAFQNLRASTERTTRTVTETTATGAGAAAAPSSTMSRSAQVWESRIKEAMTARGFSEGETSIALTKLKTEGKAAVGEITEQMTTRVEETIRRTIESASLEGDLIHISALDGLIKTMPSITKRVPVYEFPIAIAKDLNRTTQLFNGDEVTSTFLRWFIDRPLSWWKVGATTLRLPYHPRNLVSNTMNAWLGGVNNPARFFEAANLQKDILLKNWDKTYKLGDTEYTVRQLSDLMSKHGVSGSNWYQAEVGQAAIQELQQILKYGRLRHAIPTNAGRALGNTIENNGRYALFMDQLAKGSDAPSAAKHALKWMIDYGDKTPFERSVMSRVWPFYQWTRKNSMLQIDALFNATRKYQTYGKALRAVGEPETAEEAVFRPEYFDQLVYRKSPMKTPDGKSIYMGLDLPPLEFNRLTSWQDIAGGVNPMKAFLEVAFNREIFPRMKELQHTMKSGERDWLDMEAAPVWLQWLNDTQLEKLQAGKFIGPMINRRAHYPDKDGKVPDYILGINKNLLHAINAAFPLLNDLGRTYAQPITLSDERPEMWKRSYLTGITQRAFDLQNEAMATSFETTGMEEMFQYRTGQRGRYPTVEEWDILYPKNARARRFIELRLKTQQQLKEETQ